MSDVGEKLFRASDLYAFLQTFIDCNRHAPDVRHRWLASYASGLLTAAYDVNVNNQSSIKVLVDDFRRSEICYEISEHRKKIDRLESESAKLST